MKRLLFILLVLVPFTIFCQNKKDNSVFLLIKSNGVVYIDAKRVTSNSNILKSWVRLNFSEERKKIVAEHYKDTTVSYGLMLFEFDIKQEKHRMLVQNTYNKSGGLLIEDECRGEWEYIVPGSFMETIFINVKDIAIENNTAQ